MLHNVHAAPKVNEGFNLGQPIQGMSNDVVFDKPEVAIPIEAQAAQDVAVAEDGSAAVLDRFSSKSVTLYDEKGSKVGEIPLKGEELEETGLVTGVFVDGNDVYVEKEHGPLYKVGDKSGAPADEQTEIPGRPSRDGLSFLKAGVIEPALGRVYVASVERATMQHRFTRELRLDAPVQAILLLDSDKTGMIYFATQVERAPGDEVVFLTCLEPLKGLPVGTAVLPVNTLPEETFRDLVVLDGDPALDVRNFAKVRCTFRGGEATYAK